MVTVLPLKKGLINLGAGRKVYGDRIVHCEEDGDIKIHWNQDNPDTIVIPDTYSMVTGDDRLVQAAEYIEVVSGVFTFGD